MKSYFERFLAVLVFFMPLAAAQQNSLDVAPPPIGQMVDIGGRKLHMNCAGKGSPTVILENGSSSFSWDWVFVQKQVSAFTRICSYDRAGFAWSDRGPAINTVEETMDDLHLLLRAASIPPPYILVGHSMGGMYVRAYQRRYPQEVVGLVLVDATPEEDLGYTVNGVDKTGVTMTYEDMETVFAQYISKSAPLHPPSEKIEEPYDKLTPELQKAQLWAAHKLFVETDWSHAWVSAESWRQEFAYLLRERREHPYVLGDLPLIVLHRGRRSDPVLDKREAELATMSRNGQERVLRQKVTTRSSFTSLNSSPRRSAT